MLRPDELPFPSFSWDQDISNLKINDGLGGGGCWTEDEGSQELPLSGVAVSAPERALQDPERNGAAGQILLRPRLSGRHLKKWKRGPSGSRDTPLLEQKITKRSRAQTTGHYVSIADSLARTIIQEGYPEQAVTPKQLTFLRGADAKLKVMSLNALQRRHRAAVWVPSPPVPAATVLRLERQNPGIATASWQIFAENAGTFPEGRNLILGIPESSVLKLRLGLQGLH
ncbi:hypothetical protein ACFW04_010059 [Cataglyphis niger]